MEQDHENQRKEMNDLFGKQKESIVEDYEQRLKEMQEKMSKDFETMRTDL